MQCINTITARLSPPMPSGPPSAFLSYCLLPLSCFFSTLSSLFPFSLSLLSSLLSFFSLFLFSLSLSLLSLSSLLFLFSSLSPLHPLSLLSFSSLSSLSPLRPLSLLSLSSLFILFPLLYLFLLYFSSLFLLYSLFSSLSSIYIYLSTYTYHILSIFLYIYLWNIQFCGHKCLNKQAQLGIPSNYKTFCQIFGRINTTGLVLFWTASVAPWQRLCRLTLFT